MPLAAASRTTSAHILIVDDNGMGLIARRTVLEELGHRVYTCSSPHDALEECEKQRFDLVVTDYKMPKMNGIQFIEELRKRHPAMSVILISGFADTLGLNESSTGADVVLQKSANEVSHLIRAVNRLLKGPAKKPVNSQPANPRSKRTRAAP
jgi:CheY-like chemotaxis protein